MNKQSTTAKKPLNTAEIRKTVDQLVVVINLALFFKGFLEFSDPAVGGIETTLASDFYPMFRPMVDLIYMVTTPLLYPVDLFLNIVTSIIPALKNEFFPVMNASIIGDFIQKMVMPIPLEVAWLTKMKTNPAELWMPGKLIWATWFSMLFYQFCIPVTESLIANVRNLVLNFYTESLYNQEKEESYKKLLQLKNKSIEQGESEKARLKKEDAQLREALIKDALTGTYNRRFYSDKVRELFNHAKTQKQVMTVLMVDIDHFKSVNDTYGHQQGDEVLVIVSSVLKKFTPSTGYCCRYGGEEFSILLPNTPIEQAVKLAEMIRVEVERTVFPSQPALKSSVSLGIASGDFAKRQAHDKLPHYEDLVHIADDKLYEAKTTGRNKVCQLSF